MKSAMTKLKACCVIFLSFAAVIEASNAVYNVLSFGAKPDGKSDSTQPFLKAWSMACNSVGPATLYVPRGSFLVRHASFNGPCKSRILVLIRGKIVAPSNYWELGKSGYWILFYKVSGVTVSGGTLDARGAGFWSCRKAGKTCPPGAMSFSFVESRNVVVKNLRSMNSQLFHIAIHKCQDVELQIIKISSPSWSLNTDGVHLQSSTGIAIRGAAIRTGDDCVSLGPGCKNVWIQGVTCGPGHGISLGSLAESSIEAGLQNVTVTEAIFTGTQNGVRIKSFDRKSSGFAKNVIFRDIIMKNVLNPIIVDQKYCPVRHGCPRENSSVKISGVTYKNIKGTSASKVAVNFACSPNNPCEGLKLEDVRLTYRNRKDSSTKSSCRNARGSASGVVVPQSCL